MWSQRTLRCVYTYPSLFLLKTATEETKQKKPGSLEVELNDYLPGVLVALTVYLLSQQQRAGSRQTRKEEEEEEEEDEDESEEDVDEDEDDTDDEN